MEYSNVQTFRTFVATGNYSTTNIHYRSFSRCSLFLHASNQGNIQTEVISPVNIDTAQLPSSCCLPIIGQCMLPYLFFLLLLHLIIDLANQLVRMREREKEGSDIMRIFRIWCNEFPHECLKSFFSIKCTLQ